MNIIINGDDFFLEKFLAAAFAEFCPEIGSIVSLYDAKKFIEKWLAEHTIMSVKND